MLNMGSCSGCNNDLRPALCSVAASKRSLVDKIQDSHSIWDLTSGDATCIHMR